MARVRNIALILLVSLIAFSAVGNKVLNSFDIKEFETRSYLEGRSYLEFPVIDRETIQDGTFQSSFEQYVSDSVVGRDNVLLANASLQRAEISFANIVLGYDVYPTFLGSNSYVIPSLGIVCESPGKKTEYTPERISGTRDALDSLSSEYSYIDWYICILDRPRWTNALPTHDLFSDSADYDYVTSFFQDIEGCEFISFRCDDSEVFANEWFNTDGHWQIDAAKRAYETICTEMDITPYELGNSYVAWSAPFCGSAARTGLFDAYHDQVRDIHVDTSSMVARIDGQIVDMERLDAISAEGDSRPRFANAYAERFHGDYGLIEIDNPNAPIDETLLILPDSFSNNSERFFACTFKRVIALDIRHTDMSIESAIEQFSPDRVLFMNTLDPGIIDALLAREP